MIENLKGNYETVNFKENMNIKLYTNDEFESYPNHWHTPAEIIMPIDNIYTVSCSDHTFTLRENDIIIISPCCAHELIAPENGKRIIFQPDINVLKEIRELETILSILFPVILITPEEHPEIHPKIQQLLLDIEDEYNKNTILAEASIYSKLLSIFIILGRNHTENMQAFDVAHNKQLEYSEKFIYICDYIGAHCTEKLTLDFIANLAGFSKYHFTRLFKQFTNISFYKYLNKKRIETAEKLLLNPDYSITDIALNSGFSNLSSFIRMFKIIKNCTPTEFRNMYHL